MPVTNGDKFLIKNLFTSEDYNAKQLVRYVTVKADGRQRL